MPLIVSTVSAADTATRVTASLTDPAKAVLAVSAVIQAYQGNTADIVIGDSTVVAVTTGVLLSAGGPPVTISPGFAATIPLQDIYFASTSSASKVVVFYLER